MVQIIGAGKMKAIVMGTKIVWMDWYAEITIVDTIVDTNGIRMTTAVKSKVF